MRIGLQVRVTGGKYNGFEGTVLKACETVGSIVVILENKAHELVVDLAHLTELTQWRASKSATELALKGAS